MKKLKMYDIMKILIFILLFQRFPLRFVEDLKYLGIGINDELALFLGYVLLLLAAIFIGVSLIDNSLTVISRLMLLENPTFIQKIGKVCVWIFIYIIILGVILSIVSLIPYVRNNIMLGLIIILGCIPLTYFSKYQIYKIFNMYR